MSLSKLHSLTTLPEETVEPFLSWEGSKIQNWKVTFRLLNVGDLVELSRQASQGSPMESSYLSKIHLIAAAVTSMDGTPLVTDEEVERYNKRHNLTGTHQKSLYEYKVLLVQELSELIVNRLVTAYDELQMYYATKILGHPLPDGLETTIINDVDLSKDVGGPNEDTDQDNAGSCPAGNSE